MFYDDGGRETARFRLDRDEGRYGVNVPAGTWHNLTVIEPAVIFEAKDGRYEPLGPEDILETA